MESSKDSRMSISPYGPSDWRIVQLLVFISPLFGREGMIKERVWNEIGIGIGVRAKGGNKGG